LLLNTDSGHYSGSDFETVTVAETERVKSEGLDQSLLVRLPPLSTLFYKLKS